jgi:hypothetical protein
MWTMVPLPAAAGTPVAAVDVSGGLVAALCGDRAFTGTLAEPDAWAALCPGSVGVAVRGDRLFTGREREVVAVELATGRQVGRVGPTDAPLQGFAVSADGRRVALGEYRTPSVWDVESGRRIARWRAHSRVIPHLAFSPDGRRLATRSFDELAIWSWRRRLRLAWRAHAGQGYGGAPVFLPDGRLAGAVGERSVGVWSARARLQRALPAGDHVRDVAIAPDGGCLAARHAEAAITVWSWPDGDRLATGTAERMARGLVFDGAVLVAGDDAALMTWGEGVPAPAPERFVPHLDALVAGEAPPSALDWERLSVEAVEAAARAVPWLRHLGAATEYDAGAERIDDWADWHGPEDESTSEYDGRALALTEPIDRAMRGLERPDVGDLMASVGKIVHERARSAVPYDPHEDAWHGPTNATAAAEYVARILAGYAAFGWPIPADLRAIWGWYEAGHWPFAFAGSRLVVY